MSNLTTQEISPKVLSEVLIAKNTKNLTDEQKVNFLNSLCQSLGMNPLSSPFEFMILNGKEVPYAKRDATDQLRKLNKVSVRIVSKETIEGVHIVTAEASTPDGRVDSSTGAVSIAGLKGDALANALMKCETKAKRRVTLSICGLGFLDETEVETIPQVRVVAQKVEGTPALREAYDQTKHFNIPENPGDYVITFGKKHIGKKLSEIPIEEVENFIVWLESSAEKKGTQLSHGAAELREAFHQLMEMEVDKAAL